MSLSYVDCRAFFYFSSIKMINWKKISSEIVSSWFLKYVSSGSRASTYTVYTIQCVMRMPPPRAGRRVSTKVLFLFPAEYGIF
jgi:hypothetical protein